MNLEYEQAKHRVADAKTAVREWEAAASAELAKLEGRRPTFQNPQTYQDRGKPLCPVSIHSACI